MGLISFVNLTEVGLLQLKLHIVKIMFLLWLQISMVTLTRLLWYFTIKMLVKQVQVGFYKYFSSNILFIDKKTGRDNTNILHYFERRY